MDPTADSTLPSSPTLDFASRHGLGPAATLELQELLSDTTDLPSLDAGSGPTQPTLATASSDTGRPVGSGGRTGAGAGSPGHLLPDAYSFRGVIGMGGMGDVWRVHDRNLNRTVAMKVLRSDRTHTKRTLERFRVEAQVTAQLQHPGIVPIYDIGQLSDERIYFTMKEVSGRSFRQVIRDHSNDGGAPTSTRALVDSLYRVCEAVAYAHARGVVHRDLKPDNIMVGDYGEVLVLDWGLVKVRGAADDAAELLAEPTRERALHLSTMVGAISGTPAYMAPEQARSDGSPIGPATDVYALGSMLVELLTGKPPYGAQKGRGLLPRILEGPPPPLPELPESLRPLRTIAERALSRDPADRYTTAAELSADLHAWLDGSRRRHQALGLVAASLELVPRVTALLEGAREGTRQAEQMLLQIPPFLPVAQKRAAWDAQDRARALLDEARAAETEFLDGVTSALNLVPDLPEAHRALADYYVARHREAERRGDDEESQRLEYLLRRHDDGTYAAYLEGAGKLSLVTDPPGAEVLLHRFEEQDRHLVPVLQRSLGQTPLAEVPLDQGSYLLILRKEGHDDVRYPVHIRRREHWDGVPVDADEPLAVPLPPTGRVPDDMVYVPPGWAVLGGDPLATNSISSRRLWLDGFVVSRHPVTIETYLDYLNDLVDSGQVEAAETACPPLSAWEAPAPPEARGDQWIERDETGHYVLRTGHPRWPVTIVNWPMAFAYTQWRAQKEGIPWRLPAEMEREKAARGVDGRAFPWGDAFDATFCFCRYSHTGEGRALKATIDTAPIDESVYGVRGMGANVRDWCQDAYQLDGPRVEAGRPVLSNGEDLLGPGKDGLHRIFKGGTWTEGPQSVRCAFRDSPPFIWHDTNLGFRCAVPYDSLK